MANYNLETETTTHIKGMSFSDKVDSQDVMGGGNNVLTRDVAGRIQDPSAKTSDTPLLVSSWGDPDSHPFGWCPYYDLLVCPGSEILSSVKTQAFMAGGQMSMSLPVSIPDEFRETARYAMVDTSFGYTQGDNAMVPGYPLVLRITGYDGEGHPMCEPVNSKSYDGVMLIAAIPEDSKVVLLKDGYVRPDDDYVRRGAKNYCVVLSEDCPALSPDAKKGDVYVRYDTLLYHQGIMNKLDLAVKLYSFDEKLQSIIGHPDALVPAFDDSGDYFYVYCTDSLDFTYMDSLKENGKVFLLMMEDTTVGSDAYKKGEFLFIDFTNGNEITRVPFDYFVKNVTKKSE